MASTKKTPKKGIKRVQLVKTLHCNRCGLPTTHTLYDKKVYKCTICGSNV